MVYRDSHFAQGGTSMSNPTTSAATTAGSRTGNQQQGGSGIPHERIAMRAYQKWCQRGCPAGTDQQDWLEAEAELRTEMTQPGSRTATPASTAVPQRTQQPAQAQQRR